jgi:hypothetical protein
MTSPAQPMRLADHLPHVTSLFTAHYRSLPCCFHCARVIPAANRSKRRRAKPSESADGSLITPPPVYKLKPRPKSTQKEVTVYTNLRDVIGVHTGGPSGRRKSDKIGHSEATYIQFLDLGNTGCCCVTVCWVSVTECVRVAVERMLDYDPATRIKPMQALNHPFLREEDPLSPTADSAPISARECNRIIAAVHSCLLLPLQH